MEQAPHRRRTGKRRAVLHGHRRRTGVGLDKLLAARDDAPEAFDAEEMERFYRGEAGKMRRDHLDYVIGLWRALPDRHRGAATGRARETPKKKEKVDLTPEIRAELRGHWMRVGLSVDAFFKRLANPPSRLSRRMIQRLVGEDAPRRVRKDHLEFVLAAWEKLPDGLGRLKSIHFIPFGIGAMARREI
jgi:hypothetical protein